MRAGEWLIAKLTAPGGAGPAHPFTALGDRIFPLVIPQGTQLPAAVIAMSECQQAASFDAAMSPLISNWTIAFLTQTLLEGRRMAQQTRATLHAIRDVAEGIQSCFCVAGDEAYDEAAGDEARSCFVSSVGVEISEDQELALG